MGEGFRKLNIEGSFETVGMTFGRKVLAGIRRVFNGKGQAIPPIVGPEVIRTTDFPRPISTKVIQAPDYGATSPIVEHPVLP